MIRIPYPKSQYGSGQTQKNGYIVAGYIGSATNHNSQYVSTSDSWIVQSVLPSPTRFGASCAKVSTAQLVVFGGNYDSDTCKLYSPPPTNTWTNVAVVPPPYGGRVHATGSTVGSNALMSGGYSYYGGHDNNELWTYGTPGSWASRTSLNVTRYRMSGTAIGSVNHMFGGYDGEYKSENREFNNTTNAFTFKTNCINPHGLSVANSLGSTAIICSGQVASGVSDQNEIYVNNSWITKIPLTFARGSCTGFANNSKVHIVGGQNSLLELINNNDQFYNEVWTSKTNFIYSERDSCGVAI